MYLVCFGVSLYLLTRDYAMKRRSGSMTARNAMIVGNMLLFITITSVRDFVTLAFERSPDKRCSNGLLKSSEAFRGSFVTAMTHSISSLRLLRRRT